MSEEKYIALDVHHATTVTSVVNAAGKELDGSIIATKARPILSYLEGFSGSLHVTFEEGTYAAWLYDLLEGRVAERLVCDPRHNALLKEGSKTDRNDARKLADLFRTGMLRAVYHGRQSLRPLQELVHSYEALGEDTTRAMNRIKALYRSRGIDCAGRGVYTQKQRASWREKLPAGATRLRAELLHEQLDPTRSLRRQARKELLKESRQQQVSTRLREIPGFGPLRVARLIACIQTPHRFRTRRQFWSYVGLGLVTFDSGEYPLVEGRIVRRARPAKIRGLNRNHPPRLKEIFKSAALSAIRQPGLFKDYDDARLAQGRDPARLRLTVARKLAARVLNLGKKGGHYRALAVPAQA